MIVLCHGLLMTATLWDAVVEKLEPGMSCLLSLGLATEVALGPQDPVRHLAPLLALW